MIEKGAIIDQRLQTVNYKNPPYSTAYPCSQNIGTMTPLIRKAM